MSGNKPNEVMRGRKSEYDSENDTRKHIDRVHELLNRVIYEIEERQANHDYSKLNYPEKTGFDTYTPKLANLEYGSEEYFKTLEAMQPFLEHHYANNDHHPEHHDNGVKDMDLLQLIEMLADWKAAGERHSTGSLFASIMANANRFKMPPQITYQLLVTAHSLGWIEESWDTGEVFEPTQEQIAYANLLRQVNDE